MTIKDAKTRLIVLACMCEGKDFYDKVDAEALKLAIKSLEAWGKVRAEIKKESEVETLQLHWGEAMGLNKAIEIIDKYNEKSENKEIENG